MLFEFEDFGEGVVGKGKVDLLLGVVQFDQWFVFIVVHVLKL